MTPFDACVVPQLKHFDYKVSAVDLIKFVSNMKRNIIGISDLNLFDEIVVFHNALILQSISSAFYQKNPMRIKYAKKKFNGGKG